MAVIDGGNSNAGKANVTSKFSLSVAPETNAGANADNVGCIRIFSENDPGTVTGAPYLYSPETDDDFRLRVAQDILLDTETFNYTAQNTGKHQYRNTTMTQTWNTGGIITNATGITTTTTGIQFNTYAEFPLMGAMAVYYEFEMSFSAAQAPSNTTFEIGPARYATANPYAPTDGVYFLANSGGYSIVLNHNTATTVTAIAFTPIPNQVYQFIIAITEREVNFWIDNVLYATVDTPGAQGQPLTSSTTPFGWRHVISGGAAGGVYQVTIRDYNVTQGGLQTTDTFGSTGNRVFGAYQGLSGGTMGSLATLPNGINPTAGVPTNTTLAANLPGGLGGQGLVTATAAAVLDGIWGSYQVPAGTVSLQGKRLKITGVKLDTLNTGAAVATTATTIFFQLAFGHTAVSQATAEGAAAKAPRRIALGFATWPVGAAIGAQSSNGPIAIDLTDSPIYVNPGEFVALIARFIVGTATASQTIWFAWQPIYSWE